jgi:hypothetical protein
MDIQTALIVSVVFGSPLVFALKDWETIEFDWETKKLTIKRRGNSLPPAS